MNRTIESMWKEGFANDAHLTVPKINDLYNRKSQNIVDKLQSMFAVNIKAIMLGGFIALVVMSLIGAPLLGVYINCLLLPLILIAKKELNKSFTLSKGQSSYDYLTSFNHWLKNSIEVYARYYKIAYPMLVLGMAVQGMYSQAGGKIIALLAEKFPTDITLFGQPFYIIAAVVLITAIVAKFADALYRLDLNIIYGQQFKKLAELIADMEELRK